MRKVFATELRKNFLKSDKNSILLGDISVGLFLDTGDDLVPNAYNMGILEQSMISFAETWLIRHFQRHQSWKSYLL